MYFFAPLRHLDKAIPINMIRDLIFLSNQFKLHFWSILSNDWEPIAREQIKGLSPKNGLTTNQSLGMTNACLFKRLKDHSEK